VTLAPSLWRFAVVGVLATAVHVSVAWFALRALDIGAAPANGLAFVAAHGVSYLGNAIWSFSHRPALGNWARYLAVSALTLALTMVIAGAVERLGGADVLGIALVVLVVPGLSYLAHRRYTFGVVGLAGHAGHTGHSGHTRR
jgi:putative flippase GtrA